MNRIRDLREDRDLRQIDVANATGIEQKTLSNYETGRTNPDSYAIMRLADFFDVTTDYLLGYNKRVCTYNYNSINSVIKELDRIQSGIAEIKKVLTYK